MIKFKINIINKLKENGYNTNFLRINKIFGQKTIQYFRTNNADVSIKTIDKVCELLNMQPGDLLEYVPDPETDQTAERLNND